jgi:hypothetical protein
MGYTSDMMFTRSLYALERINVSALNARIMISFVWTDVQSKL